MKQNYHLLFVYLRYSDNQFLNISSYVILNKSCEREIIICTLQIKREGLEAHKYITYSSLTLSEGWSWVLGF